MTGDPRHLDLRRLSEPQLTFSAPLRIFAAACFRGRAVATRFDREEVPPVDTIKRFKVPSGRAVIPTRQWRRIHAARSAEPLSRLKTTSSFSAAIALLGLRAERAFAMTPGSSVRIGRASLATDLSGFDCPLSPAVCDRS